MRNHSHSSHQMKSATVVFHQPPLQLDHNSTAANKIVGDMPSIPLNVHNILATIIGLMVLPSTLNGLCQRCGNESGVYCYNATHFQTCHSGVVKPEDFTLVALRSCPPDTVCFDNAAICASPANGSIVADCSSTTVTSSSVATTASTTSNHCNECSLDGRYACVNATAFGLCFGSATVSLDYVFRCPAGEWCDVDAAAEGAAGAFCTANETVCRRF